jgi:hypothetical protein
MRNRIQGGWRRGLAALAAICVLAGAGPALADHHHDDHGHHGGHGHGDWHHHWHRPWGYDGGYYAPPPVVYGRPYYAPPPVVYSPGIGLNIHIP